MGYSQFMADISSNNSEFDAQAYRGAGHIAVAIKATEATGYENPDYRGWCYAAGGHHIAVIHYHFARPDLGTTGPEEAAWFLHVALPLAGPRDYLVCDLERATPEGWTHDPEWSHGFDDYVQHHSRFKTILYANRSTLQGSDNWLCAGNPRVWDADWSGGRDYAPPGYAVAMRQFTDGVYGPEPHWLAGVGQGDVSVMRGKFFAEVAAKAR